MSMFQQTALAAERHLAEGLALKLRRAELVEKSLTDLEGTRNLTESKMVGQAMLHLRALIIKTGSRCLLLTWRGNKFNLSKMSSYLDVLALLKNLL
jgi:hypothetical protein